MTDWQGRKPDLAPLTDAWIERQIRTGGLVPPSGTVFRAQRIGWAWLAMLAAVSGIIALMWAPSWWPR